LITHRTDLNDLVSFVVRADLVHTGGFGIENNLARNCSAHSGHLCQTYRLQIDFNYRKSTRDAKQVEIFTDGSCLGNPGPGGYGAIALSPARKNFSEGYRLTTNNRMELMAAIVALEALKSIVKWCSAPTASMCARDHPVDPQLEKTRLENGRKKPVKMSISGSAWMPRWASIRSNGNG
jgi:hypothetical protein